MPIPMSVGAPLHVPLDVSESLSEDCIGNCLIAHLCVVQSYLRLEAVLFKPQLPRPRLDIDVACWLMQNGGRP
jgi:hypothetical protein